MLVTPHALQDPTVQRQPGESAYVLAEHADSYRYLGVGLGRRTDHCHIPDVDFALWRAWGDGSEPVRRLPTGALERAQTIVDTVLASAHRNREIRNPDGRRASIVGASPRGGVRIVGSDGAFSERHISLADIAWVLVASDDATEHGIALDEQRLQRLRYLEGTPKGSTRWMDAGWAMVIVWTSNVTAARVR